MKKESSTALTRALYRNFRRGGIPAARRIIDYLHKYQAMNQQLISRTFAGFDQNGPMWKRMRSLVQSKGSDKLKALVGNDKSLSRYAASKGIAKTRLQKNRALKYTQEYRALEQAQKAVHSYFDKLRRHHQYTQLENSELLNRLRKKLDHASIRTHMLQHPQQYAQAYFDIVPSGGRPLLNADLQKLRNHVYGAKNLSDFQLWNAGQPMFATPYPNIALQYLTGQVVNKAPKQFLFRAPRQQLVGTHKPPIASEQWGTTDQQLRKYYRDMVRAGRYTQIPQPWQAGPQWGRKGWLRDYQYVTSKPQDVQPLHPGNSPQLWLPRYLDGKLVQLTPAKLVYNKAYYDDLRALGKYRSMFQSLDI